MYINKWLLKMYLTEFGKRYNELNYKDIDIDLAAEDIIRYFATGEENVLDHGSQGDL